MTDILKHVISSIAWVIEVQNTPSDSHNLFGLQWEFAADGESNLRSSTVIWGINLFFPSVN